MIIPHLVSGSLQVGPRYLLFFLFIIDIARHVPYDFSKRLSLQSLPCNLTSKQLSMISGLIQNSSSLFFGSHMRVGIGLAWSCGILPDPLVKVIFGSASMTSHLGKPN